jgi:hypothetical protein
MCGASGPGVWLNCAPHEWLGGRAAEEVVYGDVTTGAESDLQHASDIAWQMAWGSAQRATTV